MLKVNKNRVNFIFTITFIVTLLVSGASAGPYIAKVSFAQPTRYPSSSFLTQSPYSSTNASLIQITAGKIQDISFTINNNNAPFTRTLLSALPRSLSQLAVSIASQNTAVTILGPTTWDLPTISSGSGQKFATQVFASASAIGSPVFFTVTIQYIQNGYQVRTATFNLGATVVGLIQLGLNNLNVRYAGNTPTLSGNILNQGNTPALFSTIKMLNQAQTPLSSTSKKNLPVVLIPTASQYLGSVAANLPVPFNIPLQAVRGEGINNNITALAAYPVSFQITYTDNLKIIHDLIINDTVNLLGIGPLMQKTAVATNALQGNNAISISDPEQQPLPQLPFGNGFVDSYWAQNVAQTTVTSAGISTNGTSLANMLPVPVQIQTGPDYGQAFLAVELSNTAFYAISGITGYLTLPTGFTAATGGSSNINLNQGSSNINLNQGSSKYSNVNQLSASTQTYREPQTAIAAYPSTVSIGQTYTLYFKVDIGNAAVGSYLASLKLYYYQLPLITPGEYRVQTISVPFNLKGTVVLDSVPKKTTLNPGVPNPAVIDIINRGTAPARNVIAAIQPAVRNTVYPPAPVTLNTNASTGGQIITQNPPSLIPIVNVGSNTFHVGTVPPNGTAIINPIFYPSYSAGGTLQTFNMTLTYVDTGGNTQSTINSFGFAVSPEPPQAGVNIAPTGGLGVSPGVSPSNNTSLPLAIPHSHSHSQFHSHSQNNVKNGNSASGVAVSPSYTTTDTGHKTISDNTTNNAAHILPAVYKVTAANHNSNTASTSLTYLSAVANSSGNNNNIMKNNDLQQHTTSPNIVIVSSHQNNTSLQIIPAVYKVTAANHSNNTASTSLTYLSAVTNSSGNNNNIMKNNDLQQNNTSPNTVVSSHPAHQNNTSLILTALSVQDMKFHITNFNDTPITDLIASISSQSGDVKIVGDDLWTVPVIPPHTTREFSTKVYASTSLIASPVSFNVLLQYLSKGQSVAGSFILSGTVVGSIVPTVSGGLTINYIAGVPNIVGNLLNEGTTTGLFTTVQMINQPFRPSNSSTSAPAAGPSGNGQVSFYQQSSNASYPGSKISLPPPQYLGDLQSDSPLPFSIPLTVDINNTAPATYPVILRISFSDDLHYPHVTYLHDSVVVAPHPPPPSNNGGPLAFLGLGGGGPPHVHGRHDGVGVGIHRPFGIPLLIWVIIIAAIIIAVILIRRRRKAKQRLLISESAREALDDEGGDEDIESLIDSGKKGTGGDSQL
jgi:hypothetical protein